MTFLSAGETGAGKSSLLNLILGTEVLPYSSLCETSTIFRLHHSNRKRFEIIYEDNDSKTVENENDSDLIKKLSEEMSGKNRSDEDLGKHKLCRQVEIYWPIPMLQVLSYFFSE